MQENIQFSSLFIPLAVGCVSIIAWVSLRSDSLSSRVRSADKELIESNLPAWRRASLRKQVRLFMPRYSANAKALRFLLFAVTFLFGMLACTALGQMPCLASCGPCVPALIDRLTFAALLGGFTFVFLGIKHVLRDVDQGEATLFEDAEAVLRNTPERDDSHGRNSEDQTPRPPSNTGTGGSTPANP